MVALDAELVHDAARILLVAQCERLVTGKEAMARSADRSADANGALAVDFEIAEWFEDPDCTPQFGHDVKDADGLLDVHEMLYTSVRQDDILVSGGDEGLVPVEPGTG